VKKKMIFLKILVKKMNFLKTLVKNEFLKTLLNIYFFIKIKFY
jgi:hypothetical protein